MRLRPRKPRPMDKQQWRYGLIGAGRFGRFCLESLRGWERVRPVAVTDAIPALAEATAAAFDLVSSPTPEALLSRPEVDFVLISTPPHTHHELTLQALRAGKHAICEKPLALTVEQADALLAAARETSRLLVVNHLLRYSRLLETAKRIIESRLLGEPLHFFFENYAEDERLPPEHWFWDQGKSGGIFVEHAVHFFDLHRWWFGEGEVVAAHTETRPGTAQVDRVWCVERFGQALGYQYHGFDQPVRLDRADHRVVCERGQIEVGGWIPMELWVSGLVDDAQRAQLAELCQECELVVEERYEGDDRRCRGRGNQYLVAARVTLERRLAESKLAVYGEMLRALFDDQLRCLEDPAHSPRLRAEDARQAVAMAEQATRVAEG